MRQNGIFGVQGVVQVAVASVVPLGGSNALQARGMACGGARVGVQCT